MEFNFNVEIHGKVGARLVGYGDVVIEIVLLAIWFFGDIYLAKNLDGQVESNSMWISKSRDVMVEIMIGMYFSLALITSVFLIYSTFPSLSLATRKRIVTIWCLFRALSFLASMGLIIHNGGSFDNLRYLIMAAFLIMSSLSIYLVSVYLGGLDKEIRKHEGLPGRIPKRKLSSVSVLTEEDGYGLERMMAQGIEERQQFQAYLHRPSWQRSKVSLLSGKRDKENANTLTVPECRF